MVLKSIEVEETSVGVQYLSPITLGTYASSSKPLSDNSRNIINLLYGGLHQKS